MFTLFQCLYVFEGVSFQVFEYIYLFFDNVKKVVNFTTFSCFFVSVVYYYSFFFFGKNISPLYWVLEFLCTYYVFYSTVVKTEHFTLIYYAIKLYCFSSFMCSLNCNFSSLCHLCVVLAFVHFSCSHQLRCFGQDRFILIDN